MIAEWDSGESITLHKNPNYFRADEGLPKFDIVIFRITGENTNANITALLTGECDIASTRMDDQIELLLELEETGKIKVSFTTGTLWEHVDFGIQHVDYDDGYQSGVDRPDFFSDVRTRQAFALCMDRQALVEDILFAQSIVIDSYVPPQHPLYNPEVRQYEFDVEAGSALLEEVGWVDDDNDPSTARVAQGVPNVPDGTRLEIRYDTTVSVLHQNIQEILQASLAQCGIVADIQNNLPVDLFADAPEGPMFGRKFDLLQFAWGTGVVPPCDLYISSRTPGPAGDEWLSIQDGDVRTFGPRDWINQNSPGFANEQYDLTCETALGALPGQPDFETAHLEAQRIFTEQLPVVPLFVNIKMVATRPDFCGLIVDPTAANELWNIEEFDYGQDCEE
jgi:peptide/nickel transport system substrate-binding protein